MDGNGLESLHAGKMASWVEDILSGLLSDNAVVVPARERGASARIVTWLIVNCPPEWIVFFFTIGVVFSVAFVGGSAWRLSTGLVSEIFAGVSWVFGLTQSSRITPEIVSTTDNQPLDIIKRL